MKYLSLLKKIKGFSFKKKHVRTGDYMNPLRDWAIGLACATTMFIGGVVYIGYDFYSQFTIVEVVTDTEKKIVYPEKEIRNLADSYTDKEKNFNELRERYKNTETFNPLPEGTEDTIPVATTTLADSEGDEYTTPVSLSP